MSICKHQKTRDFVRNSREVNLNEIYFIWAYESWNFEHLANKTCYLSRLFHLFILRNSREVVWRFEDRLQRLSSSPQGTFQFRTKENTTRLSENSFSRSEKLRVFSVFVFHSEKLSNACVMQKSLTIGISPLSRDSEEGCRSNKNDSPRYWSHPGMR